MPTPLTRLGVIPRGLWNTVSYGTLMLFYTSRHAILGIQPAKLAAWVFVRHGAMGLANGIFAATNATRHIVVKNWFDLTEYVAVGNFNYAAQTFDFVVTGVLPYGIDGLEYSLDGGSTYTDLPSAAAGTYSVVTGDADAYYEVKVRATRGGTSLLSPEISLFVVDYEYFTPSALGVSGLIWWDATSFSAMFQNKAGTTPVTAAGQPVNRVMDGNAAGWHMVPKTDGLNGTAAVDGDGKVFLQIPAGRPFIASLPIAPVYADYDMGIASRLNTTATNVNAFMTIGDNSNRPAGIYSSPYSPHLLAFANGYTFSDTTRTSDTKFAMTVRRTNGTLFAKVLDATPLSYMVKEFSTAVGNAWPTFGGTSYYHYADVSPGIDFYAAYLSAFNPLSALHREVLEGWLQSRIAA